MEDGSPASGPLRDSFVVSFSVPEPFKARHKAEDLQLVYCRLLDEHSGEKTG